MLKKQLRLPAAQKLKNASFFKSANFTLRIANNNLESNRYAFVVKKTIDKRAVVRNRTRRVFRSCIEEMVDSIKAGHDMLFVLEKGIIGNGKDAVCKELYSLFLRKGLLKKEV